MNYCSKCKSWLPPEGFYKSKEKGRQSYCKICSTSYVRKFKRNARMQRATA